MNTPGTSCKNSSKGSSYLQLSASELPGSERPLTPYLTSFMTRGHSGILTLHLCTHQLDPMHGLSSSKYATWHGPCVVKRQLHQSICLLPSLGGLLGSKSGHQACIVDPQLVLCPLNPYHHSMALHGKAFATEHIPHFSVSSSKASFFFCLCTEKQSQA